MGRKKKNKTSQPQIQPRSPRGAVRGEPRRGQSRGSPAVPRADGTGLSPAGWETAAREVRPHRGHFFRSLQTLPDLSLGKTAPREALPQRDPHLGAGRAAQSRAAAAPYLASRLSSFFFHFSARCMGSVSCAAHGAAPRAGRGPAGRASPPAGTGAARLPRAEGARSPAEGLPPCALLKTGSSFELSPFFFLPSLLPPFPSSLLPPSPFLSPFFPSPSLSHSPAFTDGTASHCVFMYIIRQLVPSTSFASLQYLYKHITLSVACTFCYGCCHSLRDLTFIF